MKISEAHDSGGWYPGVIHSWKPGFRDGRDSYTFVVILDGNYSGSKRDPKVSITTGTNYQPPANGSPSKLWELADAVLSRAPARFDPDKLVGKPLELQFRHSIVDGQLVQWVSRYRRFKLERRR